MKKYFVFFVLISAVAFFGSSFSNATIPSTDSASSLQGSSGRTPSDFGLKEGDLISAIFSDDPDVYIVNEHGYKRLFLNPEIFKFYTHLGGFANIKLITPEIRDSFPTVGFFRNCEDNDQKVYGTSVEGEDSGRLHWINKSGGQAVQEDPDFFKKVFCINRREFNWYPRGNEFRELREVPKYHRSAEAENPIICHHPTNEVFETIRVAPESLDAHFQHGDAKGACPTYVLPTLTPQPIPIGTPRPSPLNLKIISPNGGEKWSIGNKYEVTWEHPESINGVRFELYKGGNFLAGLGGIGGGLYNRLEPFPSWTWETTNTPNFIPGSDFKIRIVSDNSSRDGVDIGSVTYDESDNYFSISGPNYPVTCDSLKSNSAYTRYYDSCAEEGRYDYVCFNKNYGTYQGCVSKEHNGCTVNNTNASQNMACPVSPNVSPMPVSTSSPQATPTSTSTPKPTSSATPIPTQEITYNADLAIVDIIPNPLVPEANKDFTVDVIIKNLGLKALSRPSITLTINNPNGQKIYDPITGYNDTLNPGATGTVKFYSDMFSPRLPETTLNFSAGTYKMIGSINNLGYVEGIFYKKDFNPGNDTLTKTLEIKSSTVFSPTPAPTPTPTPTLIPILTPDYNTLPNNPSAVTGYVSGLLVYLNWTDNSSNETGFDIYRRKRASSSPGSTVLSDWVVLYRVGANITSYTDSPLPGYSYEYRIGACNNSTASDPIQGTVGCASNSGTALFTLPSPVPTPTPTPTPTALNPPTSVSAYLGTGKITLVWPSGTAPKYNVYRCIVDYGCGGAIAYGYVYTALTAYYEDYSITPGSTYSYKVTACDSNNSNCSGGTISNSITYPASNPTASVSFDNFSRDLAFGSRGNDVKQLQALLVNEVGYSADLVTGYFGRITRDAVKRLQGKYGVKPISGYFGSITRKALNAVISIAKVDNQQGQGQGQGQQQHQNQGQGQSVTPTPVSNPTLTPAPAPASIPTTTPTTTPMPVSTPSTSPKEASPPQATSTPTPTLTPSQLAPSLTPTPTTGPQESKKEEPKKDEKITPTPTGSPKPTPKVSMPAFTPQPVSSLAPTPVPSVKSSFQSLESLRRGNSGDNVKELQGFLKQLPDVYPRGLVTGFFGSMTENAIKKLQAKFSLETTGILDTRTNERMIALNSAINRKQPPKIFDISPAEISINTKVTLAGAGFTLENNSLLVRGKTILKNLTSHDGNEVVFAVPPDMPCDIGQACPVKIVNSNGISNAKVFKLIEVVNIPPEELPSPTPLPSTPIPTPTPTPIATPQITSITPAFGKIGNIVTLLGSGFTSRGNSINFGTTKNAISDLTSVDGKTLIFTVPVVSGCQPASVGPVPTCDVSVTNTRGTSNIVRFTVTRNVIPALVIAPNGGETVIQGTSVAIKFSDLGIADQYTTTSGEIAIGGGADIGIVDESVANGFDPRDHIVGWAGYFSHSGGSANWDGKTVYSASVETERILEAGTGGFKEPFIGVSFSISPGRYKIIVLGENGFGKRVLWDDTTNTAGNWDLSDASFTILPAPSITLVSPNGGETYKYGNAVTVAWETKNIASKLVNIKLLKAGAAVLTIASNVAQSVENGVFTHNWTIPSYLTPASDYAIEVSDAKNSAVKDTSDGQFRISNLSALQIYGPNGGENVMRGFSALLFWTYNGYTPTNINVNLYKGGLFYRTLATGIVPVGFSGATFLKASYPYNSRYAEVPIPLDIPEGNDYTLEIVDGVDSSISDKSDGAFNIIPLPSSVIFKGRMVDAISGAPAPNITFSAYGGISTTTGFATWSPVFTTGSNGEFSYSVDISNMIDSAVRYKFIFSGVPQCNDATSLSLYRYPDFLRTTFGGWYGQFYSISSVRRQYLPVVGSVMDLGDVPMWPSADFIHTFSDIPSAFGVYYLQGGGGMGNINYTIQHGLQNTPPLGKDVYVQYKDKAGNLYNSPSTIFSTDLKCPFVTQSFMNGTYQWEPYPIGITVDWTGGATNWSVGQPYKITLKTANLGSYYGYSAGVAPYVWETAFGSLPPGLSLNSSTGVISGTPIAIGTYTFGIKVKDANGVRASSDITITIK